MTDQTTIRTLQFLLEDIKTKYISPEEFWALYSRSNETVRVLTVNVEILKALWKDRDILDCSDACTIDSALLQIAMTRIFDQQFERLTGREIVEQSPDYNTGRGVLIFGASEEARFKALNRFRASAGPDVWVQGSDEPTAIGLAIPAEMGLVGFFAYGYPKQERKIEEFLALNPGRPAILIGVGGAIDYFAGVVRRPPKKVALMGFEWLWRLLTQPRVRVHRIAALVPFALLLVALSYRNKSVK